MSDNKPQDQDQDDGFFRGREKSKVVQPPMDEDEGLPSINRKSATNKLTTIAGFVFIAIMGMGAIVAINKSPAEPPKKKEDSKISNRMPALEVAELAPPPPPPQAKDTDAKSEAKPEDDWMERKMRGKLVVQGSGGGSAGSQGQVGANSRGPIGGAFPSPASEEDRIAQLMALSQAAQQGGGAQRVALEPASNTLSAQLTPTTTRMVSASMLPNRNYVIAKGATLDCALETAIDSSVPGMVTCRLTRDIYSDNGKVLLLDRGSQLVGEYKSALKQGQVRMFVLWTRAKTPNGVIVNLDSPGIDSLGRSGIAGHIDNHFWERFGSAILMSFVSDSIAGATRGGNSGGTNIYSNTANSGGKVVESMLEQSANIPPTLVVNQGAHVQVMVARDLDFSGVYSLQAAK